MTGIIDRKHPSRFPLEPQAAFRSIRAFTTLVLLLAAAWASAHSPPEEAAAFHGGIALTTEAFNLELLVEDSRLQLFVRDRHNRPLDVNSSTATALAWGQDDSVEIEMKPGDRGALVGELQLVALKRVIVTLHMPDHEAVKAWFSGISN
ncbi:MAG: hypothetical protein LC647_15070 [Beggiatoa sp.]|nr:hypothetical protein [Beggiatoa sp.]